ncbi:MAG: hypothetical protein A2Z27_04950 [candidate division Zixibacteria bacterium RBG_16_50_21]|nr:MAG: hypothetical protein A2Z27_04950 [candidate division Zixibacteria bacterium RBG_16_50_21]
MTGNCFEGVVGYLHLILHLTAAPIVAVGYSVLSNRTSDNRLFKKPSEKKTTASRSTPVEPESKLLQI